MHINNFFFEIMTFKIASTCFDPQIIYRELDCSLLVTFLKDDLRIETCWSDFKCFNVKKIMYVH